MPQERSSHRLLRHACSTCGTNETVVNIPATKPSRGGRGMGESLSFSFSYSEQFWAFHNYFVQDDEKIFSRQAAACRHLLVKHSGEPCLCLNNLLSSLFCWLPSCSTLLPDLTCSMSSGAAWAKGARQGLSRR